LLSPGSIFVVQIVGLDVLYHRLWNEVANRHVSAAEEADLGGRNVVLHKLLDYPDIVLPLL
jgi:hypothetical protein